MIEGEEIDTLAVSFSGMLFNKLRATVSTVFRVLITPTDAVATASPSVYKIIYNFNVQWFPL